MVMPSRLVGEIAFKCGTVESVDGWPDQSVCPKEKEAELQTAETGRGLVKRRSEDATVRSAWL